jgi:prepilin-type N-terminal cleavage/methylation domain-containing protein
MNNHSSQGVSLIEFIISIIVISIISSIIIATFYDPKDDAYQDTLNSVANSLTAASATNYRLSRSGSPSSVTIASCPDTVNALKNSNQIPSDYSITPSTGIAPGVESGCILTAPNGDTANFQTIGTS